VQMVEDDKIAFSEALDYLSNVGEIKLIDYN